MEFVEGEDLEELASRHRRERRDLEGKTRAMLKKANKKEKPGVEAQCASMDSEMKSRHEKERNELENAATAAVGGEEGVASDGGDGDSDAIKESKEVVTQKDKEAEAERLDREAREKKKAQKAKRSDKKAAKLHQEELEKEEMRKKGGPDPREEELLALNTQLFSEGLEVKAVTSDGNCLYRAVADQLTFTAATSSSSSSGSGSGSGSSHDYKSLRIVAGSLMRASPFEYAPFLGMEPASPEFDEYCANVEDPMSTEWGGQVELKAMSAGLERRIWVYDMTAPVLKMGDEWEGSPLKVTYHRHYYSLGEHYNSTKLANGSED
jgi:OTU domain-containing protein 6